MRVSSGLLLLAAAGLLVAAAASLFEVRHGGRAEGGLAELDALREREDVNVVFLLIDTLRADHLGAYGYARDTSPHLDALAASGVRFAQVRAQSTWTKCSMASLWTGAWPATTGILRHAHALGESVTLPAEILKAAGFATAGIYRNGWVANNFGFAQGFDLYVKPVPSRTPGRVERRTPSAHPLQGTDYDATETALEFLRGHREERFFLYVHYMDVHQYLYDEASAHFGTRYEDAYDNAIHWTDRNVAALWAGIAELGLADRTLLVVASDHGEAFYEHGREGHARDLYAETTETPWILVLPFRLAEPAVVAPLVRNVDLWPTLLDLLGLPPLDDADGRSRRPEIRAALGGPAAPEDSELAHAHLDQTWGRVESEPRPLVSITEGAWRLLYPAYAPENAELYHRVRDPGEQHDVAGAHPEETARLRARAESYLAGEAREGMADEVELDAMRLEQLRALGYVIGK